MDKLFLKILKNIKIIIGLNYFLFLEDLFFYLKKVEFFLFYKDLCYICIIMEII